ncbi:MAG: PAS domain S-box protein [Burkholderiaceae bacterium]|nr:MAG: PAS domain S-box protein [Burkholderiaceae bacterium]
MPAILKNFLRNTAFSQQLKITVTTGVLCIALFSSVVSSWQGSRQIRQTLRDQGERIAVNLANASTLALLYNSAENADQVINTTLAFPDVIRVEIRNPNGNPVVLRGEDKRSTAIDDMPPPPTLRAAFMEMETSYDWRFIAPVLTTQTASAFDLEQKQEMLGYVRVVQSKATLTRMMTRVFLVNLLISFFFAAAFLWLIQYLSKRLTQPITALSQTMLRAERGEANVRANLVGAKDIVDMAQAFNSMIAALHEREQALRESQASYREVVESVNEVIFQTDVEGNLVFLNPAWKDVTGREVAETLNRPLKQIIEPDSHSIFDIWQARMMEQSFPQGCRYEVRFRRANQETGWLKVTQKARTDDAGNFAGTAGVLSDITERRAAEEQLKNLNTELEQRVKKRTRELEASNRELEAFSYSVSHDLRAPLRGIGGFAYILEEDYGPQLDEQARGHLKRIRVSAQRMAQLIDDLLELSRLSRVSLNLKEVNLSAMAQQIFSELAEAEPNRKVEIVVGQDLMAEADPTLIRTVLDNLIRNAWKFTGKQAQARIEFNAEQRDGTQTFFVRDNGAGFDMNYASQLFQPFSRLHSMDQFSGTGVGLATAHRVMMRHHGKIWAEAEPEKGATFYFTLNTDSVGIN